MSNILNSEDFGLKIYNRFPPKYREDDAMQQYALKRFLEALADGGFKYSIEEINGINHLVDPNNADAKVLPILFKQYGLDVFNGIPEEYLRKLLPNISTAWSKKGSLVVIEFITSSLSGVKTTTEVEYDEDGNPLIDVRLEMDSSLDGYFPDAKQFNRILDNFLPFYCDKTLIYVYVFNDPIDVETEEEDFTEIMHNAENDDIGILLYGVAEDKDAVFNHAVFGRAVFNDLDLKIPTEIHFDVIKLNVQSEIGVLRTIGEEAPLVIKDTFIDSVDNKVVEECTNVINYTSSTNSTFYTGMFGKAVFGDNSFDKHDTIIT